MLVCHAWREGSPGSGSDEAPGPSAWPHEATQSSHLRGLARALPIRCDIAPLAARKKTHGSAKERVGQRGRRVREGGEMPGFPDQRVRKDQRRVDLRTRTRAHGIGSRTAPIFRGPSEETCARTTERGANRRVTCPSTCGPLAGRAHHALVAAPSIDRLSPTGETARFSMPPRRRLEWSRRTSMPT